MFPQPRWLPPENHDEKDDHDEDYDEDYEDDNGGGLFDADQGVVDEAVLLLSLYKPIPLQLIVFMMMLMMVNKVAMIIMTFKIMMLEDMEIGSLSSR